MSKTVHVSDIQHPTKCWKQQTDLRKPKVLARCGFKKGHKGPHAWEVAQETPEAER